MHFGLFNLLQRRDLTESKRAPFEHMSTAVKLAEDMDFEIAWFGEHHFSDYCLSPSPLIPITYCAGQTSRIRLASGVLVLPLYDPMRLIQEIGMVDQLCDGRYILGVGTGYQGYEFERFGLDLKEGGDRFMEMQDILEMGLSTGKVEYEGKYYSLPPTEFSVPPTRGLPDVVVAGVLNHPGIRQRVVRDNHMILLSPGWNPFTMMEEQRTRYEKLFEDEGQNPDDMRLSVMRFVFVTDNVDEARRAVEQYRYSTRVAVALRFDYGEFDGTVHRDIPAREEPTLEQMMDNMVIGDAESVAEQIVDEIQRLRPYHYICFMKGGDLDSQAVLKSMERLGNDVLPMVHKALPDLANIGVPGQSQSSA